MKPVGHSRRPQQPIHGLPSECYRDDHRGQQGSIEDINPYHDIGRARMKRRARMMMNHVVVLKPMTGFPLHSGFQVNSDPLPLPFLCTCGQ